MRAILCGPCSDDLRDSLGCSMPGMCSCGCEQGDTNGLASLLDEHQADCAFVEQHKRDQQPAGFFGDHGRRVIHVPVKLSPRRPQDRIVTGEEVAEPAIVGMPDGYASVTDALRRTLDELDLEDEDAAAGALACRLANLIDAERSGGTSAELAGKLLAVLTELGATPAARKAVLPRGVHRLTALLEPPGTNSGVFSEADVAEDLIDTRVAVRIGRQAVLTRRSPLHLQAFIWEPVLHTLLGGEQVMLDQLVYLRDIRKRSNVDVRIIPTRTTWNPGWEGPFSVAKFPTTAERAAVVQLENKVSALFLDDPNEIAPYLAAGQRAEEVAISSEASAELIASVINEKETTS